MIPPRKTTSQIVLAALWPKVYKLRCMVCDGRPAKGGHDIDGVYVHAKCHTEDCR